MVAYPSPVKKPGTQESASVKPQTVNEMNSGTARPAFSISENSNGCANSARLSVGTWSVALLTNVRTNVDAPTTQVPTDNLALFAQPYEFGQMIKAALAVPECISFTVWGFGDADSWVPGFFTGEGYATIYDVNLQPKPAYSEIQQDLALGAFGAPRRRPS